MWSNPQETSDLETSADLVTFTKEFLFVHHFSINPAFV